MLVYTSNREEALAAYRDAGANSIVVFKPDTEQSPYRVVLDEAIAEAMIRQIFQDGDDNLLFLDFSRMNNMTQGGRPSDNARSTARAYLRDPAKFREDFKKAREDDRSRSYMGGMIPH